MMSEKYAQQGVLDTAQTFKRKEAKCQKKTMKRKPDTKICKVMSMILVEPQTRMLIIVRTLSSKSSTTTSQESLLKILRLPCRLFLNREFQNPKRRRTRPISAEQKTKLRMKCYWQAKSLWQFRLWIWCFSSTRTSLNIQQRSRTGSSRSKLGFKRQSITNNKS